jgi:hypothetical protein
MRGAHVTNAPGIMAPCRNRTAAYGNCAARARAMKSLAAATPHAGDVREAVLYAASAWLS